MRYLLVPAYLLALALAAGAVPAPAEKKTPENLDGTWICTFMDSGEVKVPDPASKLSMKFSGATLVLVAMNEKKNAKVRLDFSKRPAEIDITPSDGPHEGKLVPGIFLRDGDTLKICAGNQPGGVRPTEFKADNGRFVVTLKLQK